MIKNSLIVGVVLLFLVVSESCQRHKIPLDDQQFTNLLIDMHRLDGALTVRRDVESFNELQNYAYYNDLFQKYGITRSEFDSCMHYYSAKSEWFAGAYDVVIDSLNKELTKVDKLLKELKANDSVNYFPVLDTLFLDSVCVIVVDSIVPGLYKFSTKLQFDSLTTQRVRSISSFFLSADQKDTLRVRDIIVSPDTNERTYNWEQYVDSVYTQLEIHYMKIIPWEKRPKVYKKGKWETPSKKEKIYRLEDFGGKAWNNQLFRPYLSKRKEEYWKKVLRY